MNTMKLNTIKTALLGCLLILIMSGCDDWLKVDPYDKILEEEAFGSEVDIQATHNGLYLRLANIPQYGCEMTNSTVEILGQQISIANNTKDDDPFRYYMSKYEYKEDVVKRAISRIWTNAYSNILGVNFFIYKLEGTEGIVADKNRDILFGEAYAMRAFIHFDLLRLFGPVYSQNPGAISIPYCTQPKVVSEELLSANLVVEKVLNDIDIALELLKNDVVRTKGINLKDNKIAESEKYYQCGRNFRLNYFAVAALKARVLLYKGDKAEAKKVAEALLNANEIPSKFPWITDERYNSSEKEDRIFFTEVLFGIHVAERDNIWRSRFSSQITDVDNLYGYSLENLKYAFESDPRYNNDYRARNWAIYNTHYMYANKFAPIDKAAEYALFQPLIRKSELYYIMAECTNDIRYIEDVRRHRNSPSTSTDVNDQLEKEYLREFFGEGQAFYFFKRKNYAAIRSAAGTSSTSLMIAMDESKYMVPLPEDEINL